MSDPTQRIVFAIKYGADVVGICEYAKDAAKYVKEGCDIERMTAEKAGGLHKKYIFKIHPELKSK